MLYAVLAAAAMVSYFMGGINGAIILSRLIYHEDIRKAGSGNPGFTNFKRTYGLNAAAWAVMLIDILKTALPVFLSALTFSLMYDLWQFGAAFGGFCCMLGHCFPIWYRFRGGKAFLAGMATIWFVDWRVGAAVTIVFLIILFTTHYMSVASCTALALYPILLAIFGVSLWIVELIAILSAVLVIARHWKNFVKLANKQESKFSFRSKKKTI